MTLHQEFRLFTLLFKDTQSIQFEKMEDMDARQLMSSLADATSVTAATDKEEVKAGIPQLPQNQAQRNKRKGRRNSARQPYRSDYVSVSF